jgi:hypothetical protein
MFKTILLHNIDKKNSRATLCANNVQTHENRISGTNATQSQESATRNGDMLSKLSTIVEMKLKIVQWETSKDQSKMKTKMCNCETLQ